MDFHSPHLSVNLSKVGQHFPKIDFPVDKSTENHRICVVYFRFSVHIIYEEVSRFASYYENVSLADSAQPKFLLHIADSFMSLPG